MRYIIIGVAFLMIFSSCKTLKVQKTDTKTIDTELLKKKKVVQEHEKAAFGRKTLEAKIDASYDDGENTQDVNIKLRIEKDKTIWMSGNFLGIPMAKIMITPDRIQYYEKIHKTYFDGDFSLLKEAFGVDMTYEQVQNLLLGQALFSLKNGVNESMQGENILLTPIHQNEKFDIFYLINPANYKLQSQEAIISNNDTLRVMYSDYETVKGQKIPSKIKIESVQSNQNTKIKLDIRNIELDNKLKFPFEIPEGYNELNFSDFKKE